MRKRIHTVALITLVTSCLVGVGCGAGIVPEMLNPEFVDALFGVAEVASIPGAAPALLVEVENRTTRVVQTVIEYRDADGEAESMYTSLEPFQKTATALICPIDEITLGSLSNANAVGAIVRLGNGTTDDPYIEVDPFGVILKDGVNYNCGDGLTFTVVESDASSSGYQIFVFIRRADSGS